MTRQYRLILLVAAAVAFALKVALAFTTFGTNDVILYGTSFHILRHEGGLRLYQARVPLIYEGRWYYSEVFNHPPLVIYLLNILGNLAEWLRISFGTMLRLASTLADLGSFALVYKLCTRVRFLDANPFALIALALCPVSVFVSGFHGNTDPIMMLCVLLSLYFLEVRGNVILSAIALGFAMEIKIVPVILVPTFLLYLQSWRDRFAALVGTGIVALGPAIPYLYADAGAVFKSILAYNSFFGHWGITWITSQTSFGLWYYFHGKIVLGCVLASVSIWLNYPRPRAELFDQWGIIFFLFLFLAPGFGIQYLDWLVPWVVTLGPTIIVNQYALNGTFMFLVYTFWSGGLPWYFANSLATGTWRGWLALLQCVVWASIAPTLLAYGKRMTELDRSTRQGGSSEVSA